MTSEMGVQMSLLDLDMPSTKMFPEHYQAIKTNSAAVKTSAASSKKCAKSSKPMLAFLDLRGNGPTQEASSWTTEALLGLSRMHSIGECHNAGSALLSYVTSTDLQHQGFCLTLNLSEHPRVENPTLLSEVLEEEADAKYKLSAKACRGILNRASKRGKQLPSILQEALENQIRGELDGQTEIANS